MDSLYIFRVFIMVVLSRIEHTISLETDYIWPLNYPFYGYETKQGRKSLHPSQDRSIPYVTNSNTYLNKSSALVFNGSNYIDVPIGDSVLFSTLTFNIFLKATYTNPHSVIAHYMATSPKPNTIRQFVMEGNDNDFEVIYIFNDGTEKRVKCGGDWKIDEWKLYTILQSNLEEKLFVYFDLDHEHHKSIENFPTQLNVPGILRFGGHQNITNIGVIGEMSCATLLNKTIPLDVAAVVAYCDNVPSAPPDNTLVWPLDVKALGYEVKTNTEPSMRVNPLQFKPGPMDLLNEAIHFDGWPLSKISTKISSELLQHEFGISFYIRTMLHSVGTILHISSKQVPLLGIVSIKLEMIVNGIKLTVNDASGPCGDIIVTETPSPWIWRVLGIQRNISGLFLSTENITYNSSDTCTPATSSQDMQMTIGGGSEIDEGFKGQLRCLAVFDYVHDASHLRQALIALCTSADVYNFSKSEILKTLNHETTYQKRIMVNKEPPLELQQDATTFNVTKSLSDCGRRCLLYIECRSYTFNDQTKKCVLYSVFLVEQLIPAIDENYYVVTSKQ